MLFETTSTADRYSINLIFGMINVLDEIFKLNDSDNESEPGKDPKRTKTGWIEQSIS